MIIDGDNYPLFEGASSKLRQAIDNNIKSLHRQKNRMINGILSAVKLESALGFPVSISSYGNISVTKSSKVSDDPDRDFLILLEAVCDTLKLDISQPCINKDEHTITCNLWGDPAIFITHTFSDQDICIPVTTYETREVPVTKYVCTSK